jgi:hypothetical protein
MITTKGTPKTLWQAIDFGLDEVHDENNDQLVELIEQYVSLFIKERFCTSLLEHCQDQSAQDAIVDLFLAITWRKPLLAVIERAISNDEDDFVTSIHIHIVDFLTQRFIDARLKSLNDPKVLEALEDLFFEITLLKLFEIKSLSLAKSA